MPRKVTEEALERMKKLKGEGLTYGEIAEKIGLSRPTVAVHLRDLGAAGLLERHAKKLRKWEPVRRRVSQGEVSVDKAGFDVFAWAAKYFKGYREVDLYIDDKERLLGIKPVAKGQRTLSPKKGARGFFVACSPLMKEIGVNGKKRVPAEWSEKGKMLLVDLRGYHGGG